MESDIVRIPAIRINRRQKCKGYLSLYNTQFVFSHDLVSDVYPFDLRVVTITESKAKVLGLFQKSREQIIHININQRNEEICFCVANGTAEIINQALSNLYSYYINSDNMNSKAKLVEQNKLGDYRSKAKEKRLANWERLQEARTNRATKQQLNISIDEDNRHSSNNVDPTPRDSTEEKSKSQATVIPNPSVINQIKTESIQSGNTNPYEGQEKDSQLIACLEAVINKHDYQAVSNYPVSKMIRSDRITYQSDSQNNKSREAAFIPNPYVIHQIKTESIKLGNVTPYEGQEKKRQIQQLIACLEAIINMYDYQAESNYSISKMVWSDRFTYQNISLKSIVYQQLVWLLLQRIAMLEDIENKLISKTSIDTNDIHKVANIYLNIKNKHQGKMALHNELLQQFGYIDGNYYYYQIVD